MITYPTLCILGTNPALGRAELESRFGAEQIQPFGVDAVLLNIEPASIKHQELGGTVKVCKVLTELPNDFQEIRKYLVDTTPEHSGFMPEGKLTIGISFFNITVNEKQLSGLLSEVKRAIKVTGKSVRTVPNKQPALNSAQVIHNDLIGPRGWELVIVGDGRTALLAQAVSEQNIEKYAARDQARPKRDARVGMLPPKLAQIIVNLAVGKDPNPKQISVLDPFCGTGVVLQEALLMGFEVFASDLEPRMVDFTKQNLDWLKQKTKITGKVHAVNTADATNDKFPEGFNAVATETYLGQPLTTLPDRGNLDKIISNSDKIVTAFLKNLANQIKPEARICVAVPVWHTPDGLKHLPLIDSLERIGYNHISFEHVKLAELVYIRPNQLVGRELLVLRKS